VLGWGYLEIPGGSEVREQARGKGGQHIVNKSSHSVEKLPLSSLPQPPPQLHFYQYLYLILSEYNSFHPK
jgi:hypothetical protein